MNTPNDASPPVPEARPRRRGRRSSLFARGESMIWTTGGALVLCLAMVVGLLVLVFGRGLRTFWPEDAVQIVTITGERLLGEATGDAETFTPNDETLAALPEAIRAQATERVRASEGEAERTMLRTGNYDLTKTHYTWVPSYLEATRSRPEWAVVIERAAWGRFYGIPRAFVLNGERGTDDPATAWAAFEAHHEAVRERVGAIHDLESGDIGALNDALEEARLAMREAALDHGEGSPEHKAATEALASRTQATERKMAVLRDSIDELKRTNERYQLVMATADGQEVTLPLATIVRAYPPNQLDWGDKVGVYLSRWWEFLTDDPREANAEGGVWPAIFGTVLMTLLMSLLVVPFGVLAALYLREYAKQGVLISLVRIAVGNLAGVPSIVFGVFGLGFFCYIMGAGVDQLFFEAKLPQPTFGKGGLLWASLTLALLTLPVVIVATEEALAAVPGSMREGSYACGASKWQTMRRIVLPRAAPGIMTGAILAIARGAGEVAPLMLVGAVKMAPKLPMDGSWPYLHGDRSFMHLGFHIYDLGFQSSNSEAARPMVFTTTALLITIVIVLNALAIWARARLRRAQEA